MVAQANQQPESEASKSTAPVTGAVPKLSGSTLNMRFMQRRVPATAPAPTTMEVSPPRTTVAPMMKPSSSTAADTAAKASLQIDTKEDAHMEDTQDNGDDNFIVPTDMAVTSVDMYGPVAYLPGRRSFGGFASTTRQNWDSAYQWAYHKGENEDAKQQQQKVSDDELLRKYQEASSQRRKRPDRNGQTASHSKRRKS
jgi:hypothetical protein